MGMTADQYLIALQALLPRGAAWPRDASAVLTRTLRALAEEFARIDERAGDLIEESDPRTTLELLPDWERVAGLPDACYGELSTIQERRAALAAKLTRLGGQSRAYFIDLAHQLGYEVTIDEFRPFRAGIGRAGDPVYGQAWLFAWRVNAPETTIRYFRAGQSVAGERLRTWGNTLLECAISRVKPAHTHVIFAYA